MTVGQNLNFDVARSPDEALEKHSVVSKRRSRFRARFLKTRLQRLRVRHNPHPAASASECRLHHERVSDFVRDRLGIIFLRNRFLGTGYDRQSRLLRQTSGGGLISQQIEKIGAWTDKCDPSGLTGPRQ